MPQSIVHPPESVPLHSSPFTSITKVLDEEPDYAELCATKSTRHWRVPDYPIYGGEGGIRTHGGSHLDGFQDRCLKPLDHLSVMTDRDAGRTAVDYRHRC